jgi:hypothetical protein
MADPAASGVAPALRRAGTLRALGGCVLAGLLVGVVVAGLGSRLVMRILAAATPEATGIFTEAGNRVGEITAGGTVALLLFVGIPVGLGAGVVVFAVRRWLPARAPWRGLVLSLVLLAAFGTTVLEPENIDFRLLPPAGLAVGLFGTLFLLAGLSLAPLADRLGPGVPRVLERRDVTLAGGVLLAVLVALGLARVGRAVVELV